MKKLIKYFILIIFFMSFVFFYPSIDKYIWYLRVAHLEKQEGLLAKKGGSKASSVAKKLLESTDHALHYKGLLLSSKLNSGGLIEYIIPFINDSDRNINEIALQALSRTVNSSSLVSLRRIANTSGVRTRLGIMQVISKIKDNPDIVEELKDFKDDPSWVVRMALTDELRAFPSEVSVDTLKKMLLDNKFEVAYSAALALGNMGVENEFVEIFSHLKGDVSWMDKFLAIKLITLFPEKMVSLLVAEYITSKNNFLAVAALEWMIEKGDARDFSFIVSTTENHPLGIVKFVALKALAYLSPYAKREGQVVLTLMKYLKIDNEDLCSFVLEGLKFLKNGVVADEVFKKIDAKNIDLSYQAILTLGKFKKDKYLENFLKWSAGPHSKLREASFLAMINYDDILIDKIESEIKLCKTKEEVFALAMFLFFHATEKKGGDILLKQYKTAQKQEIRLALLEMLACVNSNVSNLDLVKLIKKKDISSWERAKAIMDRSKIRNLSTSAFADGFSYYMRRQPQDVGFSIMSFSSAKSSFWDQKDILYIAGRDKEKGGRFEGTLLYEDYNSYWCTIKGDEILRMNKEKISDICLSPLNEMFGLKKDLLFFQELFNLSLKRQKWFIAGYLLQKAFVRMEILKTEIKHQVVAVNALSSLEKTWDNNIKEFKKILGENNLVKVSDRYVSLKEVLASQLEELNPEEAKRRQKDADKIFDQGMGLLEDNAYEMAIAKFKDALDLWPFHKASLREIGTAYAKGLQFEKALEFYEKLRLERPDDVDVLNNISIIYREQGENKKALRILTQEIEIDPSLLRGRLDAAQVLKKLDRVLDAIELLESGLDIVKDKFKLYYQLAKFYRDSDDVESAISYMENALKIEPENSEALTYLAFLYFSSMKVEQAINTLKRAVAYDISYIPARLTLADIYVSEGMTEEAKKELNKILVIDPGNLDAKQLLENIG